MLQLPFDKIASKTIYKEFMSGKTINQYELLNGQWMPSILFAELVKHFESYQTFYDYLGYKMIAIGDSAYYLSRPDRESLNDIGASIQVILILLCRGLANHGISPEILNDPKGGINERTINDIGEEEETLRILKTCSIATPFSKAIDNTMVDRALMYKTPENRYVLSNSGKFLYQVIFESVQDENNDV